MQNGISKFTLVTKLNEDDTITKTLTHGQENDMKFWDVT